MKKVVYQSVLKALASGVQFLAQAFSLDLASQILDLHGENKI
jgi:hypothetical protein